MEEIERKFIVKEMPDISGLTPVHYERYILPDEAGRNRRIQKIGNQYIFEELIPETRVTRHKTKKNISEEEFESLKLQSVGPLERDSYQISDNPNISVKIYKGDFKGLVRAEVEFSYKEDAENFKPLDWMGVEITDLPLARDAELVQLTEKEFHDLLDSIK